MTPEDFWALIQSTTSAQLAFAHRGIEPAYLELQALMNEYLTAEKQLEVIYCSKLYVARMNGV